VVSIRKGAAKEGRARLHRPVGPDLRGAPGSTVPEEPKRPRLDQPWKVKLAQVVIIGALVLGAVSGPVALVASVQPARAGQGGEQAPPPSVGPEGFAQLYLRTYLNLGDQQRPEALEAFYPDAKASIAGMRAGRFYVSATATLEASEVSSGYWSVLVAAELLGLTDSGTQAIGTRYYLISVYEHEDRYVATSLPTQVPAPRSTAIPALLDAKLTAPIEGDPLADAIQQFFAAFLAGQGPLNRWITPDSGLREMTPPPFTAVTLRRMTHKEAPTGTVVVMAEASGVDAAGNTLVMHYTIELTQNDSGDWDVSGLLLTPKLAPTKG
jgi:Conjugative transposon protein TcpC